MQDQPREVIDRAFDIFQHAYLIQPITGNKARALILVSLLYTNRLMHGNNKRNEEHLIGQLQIPTRIMNRAFTSLASVIHTLPPQEGESFADCSSTAVSDAPSAEAGSAPPEWAAPRAASAFPAAPPASLR